MTYANFRLETDADGILTVTWDMPQKSMNVFDMSVLDELERIIDEIAKTDAIKGVIITSGKEAFSGGADLNMLSGDELSWLNDYHERVRHAVRGHVDDATKAWLDEATAPLSL